MLVLNPNNKIYYLQESGIKEYHKKIYMMNRYLPLLYLLFISLLLFAWRREEKERTLPYKRGRFWFIYKMYKYCRVNKWQLWERRATRIITSDIDKVAEPKPEPFQQCSVRFISQVVHKTSNHLKIHE